MPDVKTIIIHKALGEEWEESDQYQGYVPEDTTWEVIAANFQKNGYHMNNPWAMRLQKDGSPMGVLIHELKAAGEILPISGGNTPREAQFALCEVIHNNKKVIIHF
jgi:hypothetical protein